MWTKLKRLSTDGLDMDEAVALYAFGKGVIAEYNERVIPIPEWLQDNMQALANDIKSRRREYLEQALKKARANKEALKTAAEKRTDLDKEIEKLEKQLSG